MKWELYDKYKVQDKDAQEFKAKYQQKVQDAKESVTAAVEAYEAILQREFAGEAVATEKKKALENIAKSKAALKVVEEEASKAYTYASENLAGKISIQDLANDWYGNIRPSLRQERVAVIAQQAQDGLQAYYSAVQDLMRLNDEYAVVAGDVLRRAGKVYIPVADFNDLPKPPKEEDWLRILKYNQVPSQYRN